MGHDNSLKRLFQPSGTIALGACVPATPILKCETHFNYVKLQDSCFHLYCAGSFSLQTKISQNLWRFFHMWLPWSASCFRPTFLGSKMSAPLTSKAWTIRDMVYFSLRTSLCPSHWGGIQRQFPYEKLISSKFLIQIYSFVHLLIYLFMFNKNRSWYVLETLEHSFWQGHLTGDIWMEN